MKDITELESIMIQSIIKKYGIILTSKNVSELLGIGTTKLDTLRKSRSPDCPKPMVDNNIKPMLFKVEDVVRHHLGRKNAK